jgi:hypothetical protein
VGAFVAVVTNRACRLTRHTAVGGIGSHGAHLHTGLLTLAHTHATGRAHIVVLVNSALTVVVYVIAPLLSIGMDALVAIITVAIQGGVIRIGSCTLAFAVARLAVTIVIVVPIIGRATPGAILVVGTVAVVIKAVALFKFTRIGVLVAVITVAALGGSIRIAGRTQALGVSIDAILIVVSIPKVSTTTAGVLFIHRAVTVVVLAVTALGNGLLLAHATAHIAARTGFGTRVALTHVNGARSPAVAAVTVGVVGELTTGGRYTTVIGTGVLIVATLRALVGAATRAVTLVLFIEGQTRTGAGVTCPTSGTGSPLTRALEGIAVLAGIVA